ncbi:MAG: hypothetical protein L0L69_11755 [Propionibacterium sp.]|nr:hypothetical protein [Propionibacterium sp.]
MALKSRPTKATPTKVADTFHRDDPAPGRITVSIRMAPDLHQRVKLWAVTHSTTASQVVEDAVSAHLDKLEGSKP